VFRDYPVNIGQQFYYNLKDQKFEDSDLAPWVELGEAERANRRARLDQVKEAYQTIVQYGEHFENYDLIDKAQKNLNTSFRNDDDALYYVLYDIPLPE
jgi:predicted secreted acid phosphatase